MSTARPQLGFANDRAEPRPVRLTVDLSPTAHRRLRQFALDGGTTASSVVRSLLEELDRDPRLARRILHHAGAQPRS
jgi:hypothetical protein